ncbi:hypothetical protein CDAR_564291 [Caerostris darwini]|uniref:Uncharacterized protein n=1 Tax=Caerostris darwini TaxID=1538125 RepID=A0AAV4VK35_9ARAC|nr:hypothetical protein CDAR_564291 [Caerostris darwini]
MLVSKCQKHALSNSSIRPHFGTGTHSCHPSETNRLLNEAWGHQCDKDETDGEKRDSSDHPFFYFPLPPTNNAISCNGQHGTSFCTVSQQ